MYFRSQSAHICSLVTPRRSQKMQRRGGLGTRFMDQPQQDDLPVARARAMPARAMPRKTGFKKASKLRDLSVQGRPTLTLTSVSGDELLTGIRPYAGEHIHRPGSSDGARLEWLMNAFSSRYCDCRCRSDKPGAVALLW